MITTSGLIVRMAKLAMLRGRLKPTLQAPEDADAAAAVGVGVGVIVSHSLAARILETGIVADDFAAAINRLPTYWLGCKLVNT